MLARNTSILAIIGIVLVVGAVTLTYWQTPPFEEEEPKGAIAPAGTVQDSLGNASTAPQITASDNGNVTAGDADATPIIPAFDVVRVDEQGDAVIAGNAARGAQVRIMEGTVQLGETTADPNGEWVFLPTTPLQPGNRELSLESTAPDGTIRYSDHVVILVIPERSVVDNDDADTQQGEENDANGTRQELLAVLVPKDLENLSSRVLQGAQAPLEAQATAPENTEELSQTYDVQIHTIDYSETGQVNLSGSGDEGGNVRIYIDNVFIAGAPVGLNGLWRVQPQQVIAPGKYELRADLVIENQVVARAAVPFYRSEPKDSLQIFEKGGGNYITVQPGNSLWRIARHQFGQGTQYILIFERNRDQIVDPDLIYPGQIFALPEG
ncbi:MAG: LysM peptidoglycan-binding domain-containing protein [Pseudomonadota bacterium]